jgi:tetratricopeptide (TPR) repeat protein
MKRFFIGIPLLAILFFDGSYTFQSIEVQRRHAFDETGRGGIGGSKSGDVISRPYKTAARRQTVIKFFAKIRASSPVALINNAAVDLSLQERFGEAEILFKEVVAEDEESAAGYNNLGIIFEILYKRDGALRMYSTACRLEPDNVTFQKNLATFKEHGTGSR